MTESDAALDRAFSALADPVRRAIVARLSRGSATLGELAEPFDISLQAVSKHISVLEDAGLVWRTREAQRKPVHLDAAALERLTAWIDRYRLDAERSYRRLDAVLAASVPAKPATAQRTRATQPAAEPSGAEPSGAEPSGAEPSGAEPSGAEPSAAEPSTPEPPRPNTSTRKKEKES